MKIRIKCRNVDTGNEWTEDYDKAGIGNNGNVQQAEDWVCANCGAAGDGLDERTIVTLCRACASEGAAPQWVSVEEKLPELDTLVLVWRPTYWRQHFDLVVYSRESEQHRTLIRRDGQWWDSGHRITHWQPLPAPPRGVTDHA
jgi:hypothetical protein